jgi:hypothetical protein
MNRDLFLAILSMDSYNRGYGVGISDLDESGSIGNATIREFSIGEQDGWQSAGFYAIAYNWSHDGISETVVSFRGTDFTTGNSIYLDVANGWSSFTGIGTNSQFSLARQFYNSVSGQDFPNTNAVYSPSNITFTGHSLGGALEISTVARGHGIPCPRLVHALRNFPTPRQSATVSSALSHCSRSRPRAAAALVEAHIR